MGGIGAEVVDRHFAGDDAVGAEHRRHRKEREGDGGEHDEPPSALGADVAKQLDPAHVRLLRSASASTGGIALDAAVAEDDRSIDDRRDVALVGDDHDRRAGEREFGEERQDRLGRSRVEIARRLVGDKKRRVVRQGARDRGTLLLAARESGRKLVGLIGDADAAEELERRGRGAFPRRCRRDPSAG